MVFANDTLYAVLSGAGCSHGEAAIPNSIVQVDTHTGKWRVVADLSTFLKNNPAKYPDVADFEPDGIFYSLIGAGDSLYTVEPNHGQVLSISLNGIHEEVDISEAQGHIVPTSIVERAGKFYVGNLGVFPITPDSAKILTLSRDWLFGTQEARTALLTDEQLADRFEAFELAPWKDDMEFHKLLLSYSSFLPLRRPSRLRDAQLRKRLLAMSDGITVRI